MQFWSNDMSMPKLCLILGSMVLLFGLEQSGYAQTRDEKVRSDRDALLNDDSWHYDDLDSAFTAAKRESKPLMAVLRCIP
jgi:hypothetical protein